MSFHPVLLWSDLLIWLLVLAGIALGVASSRNPPLRAAWRRVGQSRRGMAAATVLVVFVAVGLLDSLHYRPRLESTEVGQPPAYAVEVLSALDTLLTPLRTREEKTYSEPLATRSYAKEFVDVREADGSVHPVRGYPRLKFGGAHLGDDETARTGDIAKRVLVAEALAALVFAALAAGVVWLLACRGKHDVRKAWRAVWRGETRFAWNGVLITLGVLLIAAAVLMMQVIIDTQDRKTVV